MIDASAVRPRWFRAVLTSVRTATTVGALTMLLGLGAVSVVAGPSDPTGPTQQLGVSARPMDKLMERNRCSFTGFDRSVIPSTALIRTPEGATRLVSFDQGWAVFSGEAPGELVAVCLGPKTGAPSARH